MLKNPVLAIIKASSSGFKLSLVLPAKLELPFMVAAANCAGSKLPTLVPAIGATVKPD